MERPQGAPDIFIRLAPENAHGVLALRLVQGHSAALALFADGIVVRTENRDDGLVVRHLAVLLRRVFH